MTPLTAIWMKDYFVLRNLRRMLQRESVFKVTFILLFATGMMGGFFAMFISGFRFLSEMGGGGFMITHRLFALFFLGLGIMLLMSNVITSYSTIFKSRETFFLLTAPLDIRTLVTYKFIESSLLSSWAFFFLMLPYTAAYAWHARLGLLFPVWTLLLAIPFVLLCGAIGTLISLAAVQWFPRNRIFWAVIAGLVLVATIYGIIQIRPVLNEDASFILNRFLPGLQLASHPLMPNSWVSEGIMALTSGQWTRGLLLWLVLITNTAVLMLLVQSLGERTFYSSFQKETGASGLRRRSAELLGWLDKSLVFLPYDIRGMVMKDIRSFLRDPMQWSQALIFFGLLAIYFSSFRSFHYNQMPDLWRNLIVFLNIFSVSSVICSLAARFVYPQLSLEGHSFWILGLAPTGMRRILLTKFFLAALAMVTVSAGLMGLAAWMLQAGWALTVLSVGLAIAVSLSAAALATGLGAIFIDLKQPNPAAIISGFGGTMNLVFTLGFMLSVILPFGFIWHWHVTGGFNGTPFHQANIAATLWVVILSIATIIIPLWLGIRSLKHREY
jgi:ABC-2 type transport system permease protein